MQPNARRRLGKSECRVHLMSHMQLSCLPGPKPVAGSAAANVKSSRSSFKSPANQKDEQNTTIASRP